MIQSIIRDYLKIVILGVLLCGSVTLVSAISPKPHITYEIDKEKIQYIISQLYSNNINYVIDDSNFLYGMTNISDCCYKGILILSMNRGIIVRESNNSYSLFPENLLELQEQASETNNDFLQSMNARQQLEDAKIMIHFKTYENRKLLNLIKQTKSSIPLKIKVSDLKYKGENEYSANGISWEIL